MKAIPLTRGKIAWVDDEMYQAIGGPFPILPSSIDEVILLPGGEPQERKQKLEWCAMNWRRKRSVLTMEKSVA